MMDYVKKYRYYLSGKESENYLLLVSTDHHLLFMAVVTMCTSDLGVLGQIFWVGVCCHN